MHRMQKRKGGRKKLQETRHPVHKGVRQRNRKWVCEMPRLRWRTCSSSAVQFAAAEAVEKHFLQTQRETNKGSAPSGRFFWDEEEVFNMPELLNSMAEALIITPPALVSGFNWVAAETTLDLTLWGN